MLSRADALVLKLYESCQGWPGSLSEADLAVLLWKDDPKRWGLAGYEALYPDLKKVTCVVAHSRFRARGLVERVAYRVQLTTKGRAQAELLRRRWKGAKPCSR